jgi:hypothetical protein
MQLKHAVLALAAAGLLSTQAYASEAQIEALQPAAPVAAFTDADLNALFDHADKPMQLAALSDAEMRETEGALFWMPVLWTAARVAVPYIVRQGGWGAVSGASQYFGGLASSGQRFNSNHLGGALLGGFTGGLLGGNSAIRSATLGAFGGGFAGSLLNRR